jgi:hypothetical protein
MATQKWTEYAPGVVVEVDADTGEIVSIDGVPYEATNDQEA